MPNMKQATKPAEAKTPKKVAAKKVVTVDPRTHGMGDCLDFEYAKANAAHFEHI